MPKQLVVFVILCVLVISCKNKQENKAIVQAETKDTVIEIPCIDTSFSTFLDIDVDSLLVREKEFSKRDNLQKLFRTLKLDKNQYAQFIEDSKPYADFTNIKPKQKYFTITKETDSTSELHYLVFKLSDFEYVIANCTDTTLVQFNKETEENISKKKKKKKQKK